MIPEDYKCKACNKKGCKLWREYQTFDPDLHCCDCAIQRYHPEWLKLEKFVIREDGSNNGSMLIQALDPKINWSPERPQYCKSRGWK